MPGSDGHALVARPSGADLPTDEQVRLAVSSFALLAEPTRLRLLWLASTDELDVSSLAARTGVSVASASAHLAKLRLAGLVEARRAGRRMLYRARNRHVRTLVAEVLHLADHQVSGLPEHD